MLRHRIMFGMALRTCQAAPFFRATHMPIMSVLAGLRVKTPRAEEGIVAVDVHEAGVVLGEHELTFWPDVLAATPQT